MKHRLAVNEHQVHRELAMKDNSAGKFSFEAEWCLTVAFAGATGIVDIAKHCSCADIQVVGLCTLE
jgi:hypothetical protein